MDTSEFNIFLNSSEHVYGLSHRDSLMLKKYCREEGYLFNSMIGGCESIRDIQESLILAADALECPAIESEFATRKLLSSIKRFSGEYDLSNLNLFINIGTERGLELLRSAETLNPAWPINIRRIAFLIDRRMLVSERINTHSSHFEVEDHEEEVNTAIDNSIKLILEEGYSYGISGGVTAESLQRLSTLKHKPRYIKSGLFTFCPKWNDFQEDAKDLYDLQRKELDVLMRMLNILSTQSKAIKQRCDHLYKYLVKG